MSKKKERIKKYIIFMKNTLFFNMTWSIDVMFNTIVMYDTYTYDIYNYDIKYNVEFFI